MATIAKFYLHDAVSTVAGTLPGAGNAFVQVGDTTGDAAGARTARAADDVIGTLQTSSTIIATANQLAQHWGHRRFVSDPLAAFTFNIGDGNWTFSYARSENNTNHNLTPTMWVYLWRPGTGAQVGSAAVHFTGTEPGTTELAESVTATMANPTSIIDGDVLVFEYSALFTQSKSSALTDTFYYDGTTEASSTSCATFVTPPFPLTLFTPAVQTSDTAIFERASGRRRTLLRM
jgi:hypothetical protein